MNQTLAIIANTWRQSRQQVVFIVMLVLLGITVTIGIALPSVQYNAEGAEGIGFIFGDDGPSEFLKDSWDKQYHSTLLLQGQANVFESDSDNHPGILTKEMKEIISARTIETSLKEKGAQAWTSIIMSICYSIGLLLFIAACSGCPIFWAAGNGNELITFDQYASSPYTISVGAVTNFDLRASYSDFGPELDLVAPSSGGTRNINTVIPGNSYTSNFGGTSASAPMAAGVAALMLEVAPNLPWSTVRALLQQSASKIQPSLASYGVTGHSLHYGHGRIDAYQAVLSAISSLPPQINLALTTTGAGDVSLAINGMAPYGEWVLGVSTTIYTPVGGGPLFGVGMDAINTLVQPIGAIPFHSQADSSGSFVWSTVGVPTGFVCQAVALELIPTVGVVSSNVVQVTF